MDVDEDDDFYGEEDDGQREVEEEIKPEDKPNAEVNDEQDDEDLEEGEEEGEAEGSDDSVSSSRTLSLTVSHIFYRILISLRKEKMAAKLPLPSTGPHNFYIGISDNPIGTHDITLSRILISEMLQMIQLRSRPLLKKKRVLRKGQRQLLQPIYQDFQYRRLMLMPNLSMRQLANPLHKSTLMKV